jgi:RNA polymerase sigma-70 factor (ECF subfamily)
MEAVDRLGGGSLDDEADRAAARRVREGDADAFAEIVERWQGPLVDLAYRFCRDPGLAEELAQDAFVRAWRALAGWRGEGRFSTWLFAVALNVYRSRLRRVRVAEVPLDALRDLADSRFVDREFDRRDRAELVRRAVLSLPEKYRDALVLFYFHEMDVAEAARTLGLPQGTVKAQLSRGREILRRKLAGWLRAGDLEEG